MFRHTSAEQAPDPQPGICRVGGFIAESLLGQQGVALVRKDPGIGSARFQDGAGYGLQPDWADRDQLWEPRVSE